MKLLRLALAGFLLATLAGCGEPVPADKSEYVGEWHGKDMLLVITQDGSMRYKRHKDGGGTTSISAPIQRFEGASFWVGVGIFVTKFEVSKPPYKAGNTWKMVVDGVELVRVFGVGRDDWKT
jgi:hypothetical protein